MRKRSLLQVYTLPLVVLAALVVSSFDAVAVKPIDRCSFQSAVPDFPNQHLLHRVTRGFNLPNWDAENPSNRPNEETLKVLHERGFTHIRLPVFHRSLMSDDLRFGAAANYLNFMTTTVQRLTNLGYAVSVDFHPGGSFNKMYNKTPERGFRRLVKIWDAISDHLIVLDAKNVLAELLNEPDIDRDTWRRHSADLAKFVREKLPDHTIVFGPSGPQRHEELFGMEPLSDPNIIYAIHFYDPFIFTHQGAEWLPASHPVRAFKQLPFPMDFSDPTLKRAYTKLLVEGQRSAATELKRQLQTPWTFRRVDAAFRGVSDWAARHQRMVIVNEFGALSHHAPRIARLTWLKGVVQRIEESCLGWTHWDYSDGFGFVDHATHSPDKAHVEMLLGKDTK